MKLETHPSNNFPDMQDCEYQSLKQSIQENGQLKEIELDEGKIVDGRHRYKACIELGIEPKTKPYKGEMPVDEYIIVCNQRRNITICQRACLSSLHYKKIVPSPQIARQKMWESRRAGITKEENKSNNTLMIVRDLFRIGSGTIGRANYVYDYNRPLFDRVLAGKEKLVKAYRTTRHKMAVKKILKPKPGRESSCIRNVVNSSSIVIPNCFDSLEVIENFMKEMNSLGWIFEMKVKDGKYYSDFYGNGFSSRIWHMEEGAPEYSYRRSVVVSAKERLDSVKKKKEQAA